VEPRASAGYDDKGQFSLLKTVHLYVRFRTVPLCLALFVSQAMILHKTPCARARETESAKRRGGL